MTFSAGRFFWKVFLVNALVLATVLAVSVIVILHESERFQQAELTERLTAQANTLRVSVESRWSREHLDELRRIVQAAGTQPDRGVRITLIDAEGVVWADSAHDPATMGHHGTRPEFLAALREGYGESLRWSHTVSGELKYVALRVGPAESPKGVVRVSTATSAAGWNAQPGSRLFLTVGGTSVAAAVALALSLGILWSRRLGRIAAAARTLSRGDLSARVSVSGRDEVAILGLALNRMRDRLSKQMETIDRQRRTLESLLSQLHEGVIVTDADGRLVLVNAEADRLLNVSACSGDRTSAGLPVEQCIRELDLQNMLRGAAAVDAGASPDSSEKASFPPRASLHAPRDEAHITLDTPAGKVNLLARAFDFQLPPSVPPDAADADSPRRGRLLVLTDVTELNKLMQVKADFAANASHELRTPLAAIRAALDTLGVLDWGTEVDSGRRTLEVIERHARRMEAMVVDLLDLSRLESPTAKFHPTAVKTRDVFDEMHAIFAEALAAKDLAWDVNLADECRTIVVNRELLRIALRNLVDNAVRFTDRGGRVRLIARRENRHAIIDVEDNGCGIPHAEQERVFERFYQVQRARSGPQRGTGLGLSIVRHAAAAMDGGVSLRSEPGRGTTVTLSIPQPPVSGGFLPPA